MIRKTIENMCIPHHEETLVQWHRGKVKYRGENSLRREKKRKLATCEHRTLVLYSSTPLSKLLSNLI